MASSACMFNPQALAVILGIQRTFEVTNDNILTFFLPFQTAVAFLKKNSAQISNCGVFPFSEAKQGTRKSSFAQDPLTTYRGTRCQ